MDADDRVDDDLAVNDEMRALLERHNLGEHAGAITELGLRTIHNLLSTEDKRLEDMRELLEERGAPKEARRSLFEWLTDQRHMMAQAAAAAAAAEAAAARLRPPHGSKSVHFYGLRASLNTSEFSGLAFSGWIVQVEARLLMYTCLKKDIPAFVF